MLKKTIYTAVIAFCLAACGSNNSGSNTTENGNNATNATTDTTASAPATDNAAPAALGNGVSQEDYDKGLALIAQSDCLTCHKIDEKLVGPAYKDVANKYKADSATVKMLAEKVIHGGAGNWGQVAMTPHPNLSEGEAKKMVLYVLSLK